MLGNFMAHLNQHASTRHQSIKTGDSGIGSMEYEMSGKKMLLYTEKMTPDIALNFMGNISMEHKPGSLKLGALYGPIRLPNVIMCLMAR